MVLTSTSPSPGAATRAPNGFCSLPPLRDEGSQHLRGVARLLAGGLGASPLCAQAADITRALAGHRLGPHAGRAPSPPPGGGQGGDPRS